MPPITDNTVHKTEKKSHFFLLLNTIGTKSISGGIGIIIDSKNDKKPRSFTEFLFSDNLIVFCIILKIYFFMITLIFKIFKNVFFSIFLFVNISIADNSRLTLNEILPGIFLYSGKNVQPNSLNQGSIANKIAVEGEKYILVFDTGPSKKFAKKFINELRKFSKKPIKYVVISHRHFDHAFGIEAYIEEKSIIFMDKNEFNYFKKEGPAINKLLINNLGFDRDNINFDSINKEKITFIVNNTEIDLGNRKILIKNLGRAHTLGDIVSYDYKTNTYLTGDLIFTGRAAAFSDADIPLWIEAIEKKLDKPWKFIIPGHGEIIKNTSKIKDTKSWLYFIDKAIKKSALQGDMISEIFEYSIPHDIQHLKMKKLTLRQGLKRQMYLYKKKYIE